MSLGQLLVCGFSLAAIAPSSIKIIRTFVAGRRRDLRMVVRREGRAVELLASDAEHAELFLRDYLKSIPARERASQR